MATIADLFSYIDSQKRRLSDTVQNPVLSLMQALGNANDQARTFNQAQQAAASEWQKTKQLNGPATQNVDRMMAQSLAPAGMTVYHGSPYRFTAFDPKKIGSGEGAQAYGHGLYVAENPAVAKQYQKNVKDMDSIQAYNKRLKELSQIMDSDSVYPGAYRKFKSEKGQNAADEYDHVMEMRDQKSVDPGNLYKIDLPDEHIDKMLDWDKPLSQQPENVKSALKNIADKFPSIPDFDLKKWMDADPLASTWHNVLNRDLGVSQPDIASTLSNQGIPGIKYNDSGSRTGPTTYHVGSPAKGFGDYTQFDNKLDALNQLSVLKNFGLHDAELKEQVAPQTRNFVVFPGNEDILKIQDVNGNPIQQ